MGFQEKLLDLQRILFLYSTTPPRASSPEDRIESAITRLVERTLKLHLDGLVVYDVQDERDRTQEERPFPFLPTLPSQEFAIRLRAAVAAPLITYKCISGMDEAQWKAWIATSRAEGLDLVSVVGRASTQTKQDGISLSQALQIGSHKFPDVTLGGVVIPERHSESSSESARLMRKAELGCRYFISQAVYDPETAIRLVRDYAKDCEIMGVQPRRVFLTFTPCGYGRTLTFMKWLGIKVPHDTSRRILASPTPIEESINICVENFRRVFEVARESSVPIGVNVESISIKKDEIEGAIDLHQRLFDISLGEAADPCAPA